MLGYLKKLHKKQIKIILVHKMFRLEIINMTFCAQNSMCLEGRKLILTLTEDKKLTFDLSIINLSFTKKVGGVEQKWAAHKDSGRGGTEVNSSKTVFKRLFTLFHQTCPISVKINAWTKSAQVTGGGGGGAGSLCDRAISGSWKREKP